MEKTRDRGIDLAKALAIFAVLMIHTASVAAESWSIGSVNWFGEMFWGCAVRWAVPVFFMCSGALFLGRDVSLKDMAVKYILRIVAALVVWSALYELFDVLRGAVTLAQALKNVVTFNNHFHFYYLIIIIPVYLLMPLLRLVVKHGDKGLLKYALAIWLFTGILLPTVGSVYPVTLYGSLVSRWYLPQTYAAVGYALLGHYLRTYPPKKAFGVVSLILGFALTFALTCAATAIGGGFTEQFWGGMTLGPCLMAAGIFSLCTGYSGESRAVTFLSRASFCAYLCHDFFNIFLRHFGLSPQTLSPIWSVPVLSLVVLAASCVVYIVLRRIPVVKKYLI